MNIVWILSIAFAVLLFKTETASGGAYQLLADQLPILPESITSPNGVLVQDRAACETICRNSRNLLFAPGVDGKRCLCTDETNPFENGLIHYPGAIFKSDIRNVRGLDYFLYMDITPIQSSRIADLPMVSLDTCALACLNFPMASCLAFSYDPVLLACMLYSKPYDMNNIIPASDNKVMYFAFLGSLLTKFSRQWGLLTPQGTVNLKNTKKSPMPNHPYSFEGLDSCATKCYQIAACDHMYYDLSRGICYSNNTAPPEVDTKKFDPKFIYIRQAKTKDCSVTPRPSTHDSGIFRSPGFPYSYVTEPCSWKFLTPWGKALSVTLNTALPKLTRCKESIQINNASSRICQAGNRVVGQSDNGLNAVDLKPSQTKSNGIAFVADYKSVWACKPGKQQLVLKGPGEIASFNYPSAFGPSVCSWKISTNSPDSHPVKIQIQFLDFKSSSMLESATLTFSDAKTSFVCNSNNKCQGLSYTFKSPVVINFQSGMYYSYPKGFKLSYDIEVFFPQGDDMEADTISLDNRDQVAKREKTDLQLHRTVNYKYTITNNIKDKSLKGIIITLGTVVLGENGAENSTSRTNCIGGYLAVHDPANNFTYTFCNHENKSTHITSSGNTLIVTVFIPPQTHLYNTLPRRGFNFSATHYQRQKEVTHQLNDTSTFTSPNYPDKYPPNQLIYWLIGRRPGKLGLLKFLDIKLGGFMILTHHYCNNDRLFIENVEEVGESLDCTISQYTFPITYVQRLNSDRGLIVLLSTNEHHLNSGFKATVEYYNAVGCNTTQEPRTIQTYGPIIQASYLNTTAGPCTWYVNSDVEINCLEGCSLVEFQEPLSAHSKKTSTIAFAGTIITWKGTESIRWFSALVSKLTYGTPSPATVKTNKPTSPAPVTKKPTPPAPTTKKPTPPAPITKQATTIPETASTTNNITDGNSSPYPGPLSKVGIAGIVVGVLFFIIVVAVVGVFFFRRYGFDVNFIKNNPFRRSSKDTSPFAAEDSSNLPYSHMDSAKDTGNGHNGHRNMHYEMNNPTYKPNPGHIQVSHDLGEIAEA